MKKSAVFSVFVLLCTLFLSSCVSLNFSHAASDSQNELLEGWTDSDLRHVADSLIQDCINSTGVINYVAATGKTPQVIIGPIDNKTEGSVDTAKLSRRLQTSIVNSGSMKLLSAPEQLVAYSEFENDYYYAREKLIQAGMELGADFIIQGSVTSRIEDKGSRKICTFFIDMELLEVQTELILWQGMNDSIKTAESIL